MILERQKRVAAVHDVSGIGKCSLTVALPVLSAAGIEAAVMPTAVLSTHTGDIEGFTYRDLTSDIPAIAAHWKSLGVKFDGIFSGFLGSTEQVRMVEDFIDDFRDEDTLVVVDPAMADSGRMYTTFKPGFEKEMAQLCKRADIIVPNLTEAAFLLDEEYMHTLYDKTYIEGLLARLSALGPKMIVLTGVSFSEGEIGCAVYNKENGEVFYDFTPNYPGIYYGTGDIFASALLGAYLNGKTINESATVALDFTSAAIARTHAAGTDTRLGVNFEAGLGKYIKQLGRDSE